MCVKYNPKQIGNAFLVKAWNEKKELGSLDLQRLVYLAYGFSLAFGRGRMCDESPHAEEYGPVFPTMNKCLSKLGSGPVFRLIRHFGFVVEIPPGDVDVHNLIDAIWKNYEGFDSAELMAVTNSEKTPCAVIWDDGNGQGEIIPDILISDHLKEFIAA